MFLTIIKLSTIAIVTTFWSTLAVITGPLNFFLPAFHLISTTWAKWLIWIGGVKIVTHGLENIKQDENYVFISNHASNFDIPILLSTIKNEIKMVAKKELTYIPIFGWSLIAGGYIIINRNDTKKAMKAMRKAEKKLNKGTSILIFPEGTRSQNGLVQPFKKGAFMLAIQTKFDIIPISIIGSYNLMPKKSLRLNRGTVHLIVEKPISVKEVKNKSQLIEDVRNLIITNCKEK